MKTELLPGFESLPGRYDHLIVDLWGTLHNGIDPLPGAVTCLEKFGAAGARIVLLSNAPFRVSGVRDVLGQIGIPDTIYEDIFCSGEIAWHAICDRTDPWHARLGRRAAFIGPDRHRPMLDNPGIDAAAEIEGADFVICTGPREPGDVLEDYIPELERAAAAGLPMICTNPDREVLRGSVREICAGVMAEAYETRYGGDVAWHGKPYRPVFDAVLHQLGDPNRQRVLMIGDGLLTDVAGAAAAGIDAAFIVGGIAAERLGAAPGTLPAPEILAAALKDAGQAPRYAMPGLIW
jgi:HAD superfamily hydrolase (TIGR01459 family)